MRKAIFLDRDGVINKDPGTHKYVHKVEDFIINPGVLESLKKIKEKDYVLFVVTNQSGIGRGLYTLEDFHKVNNHMLKIFNNNSIDIIKVYFCPHDPDENCDCRKPSPRFVLEAAKEFDIDLASSWVIGDNIKDIEMGKRAGCKTILIDSQYVKEFDVFKLKDLYNAIDHIIDLDNKENETI